jgi:hypothetical protein
MDPKDGAEIQNYHQVQTSEGTAVASTRAAGRLSKQSDPCAL